MFKVAIIGRANVGKSTLFNKLIKRNIAIVHDSAGTTRDIKEYVVDKYEGVCFTLLDTAGLEKAEKDTITEKMTLKTISAIDMADIILFVVDAKSSILPEDVEFARMVQKQNKPVILLANKCENLNNFHNNLGDFYKLGFGEPLPISAAHGQGMIKLIDAIKNNINELTKIYEKDILDDMEEEIENEEDKSVRMAIIGRPNVGKSTLVNTLVGEEKMITGDMAGITRDAVNTDSIFKGRKITLIDTAGLRKKSKIYNELEKLSTARSIETIKKADVCVIVVDATLGIDKQDLTIGSLVVNEGKGLVFVLNKWDKISNKREEKKLIAEKLSYAFHQVKNIPIICMSALKGKGVNDLMQEVFDVYDLRRQRITTGKLNKWLLEVVKKNPPPLSRLKRPMNIKYMTQSATCPPTFTIFAGGASNLPDNYMRYLINELGTTFGFDKICVRLKLKLQKNPYKDKE